MSNKRRKLDFASPDNPGYLSAGTLSDDKQLIDWTACFICQRKDTDKLLCSRNENARNQDPRQTYQELADRMLRFKEKNKMPVDFAAFEGGFTLAESLYNHGAVHHKNCKNRFSQLKLDRVLKSCKTETGTNTATSAASGNTELRTRSSHAKIVNTVQI